MTFGMQKHTDWTLNYENILFSNRITVLKQDIVICTWKTSVKSHQTLYHKTRWKSKGQLTLSLGIQIQNGKNISNVYNVLNIHVSIHTDFQIADNIKRNLLTMGCKSQIQYVGKRYDSERKICCSFNTFMYFQTFYKWLQLPE